MEKKFINVLLTLLALPLASCTLNANKTNSKKNGDEDEEMTLEEVAISFYKSFTGNKTYEIGDYNDDDDYYDMDFLKYEDDELTFYNIWQEVDDTNKVKSWFTKFDSVVDDYEETYVDEEDDGKEFIFRYLEAGDITYIYYSYYVEDDEYYGTYSGYDITILNTEDVDTYDELAELTYEDYYYED